MTRFAEVLPLAPHSANLRVGVLVGLLVQLGSPFRCQLASLLTDEAWNSKISSQPTSGYSYRIRSSGSIVLGFIAARIDDVFRFGLDEVPRIAV